MGNDASNRLRIVQSTVGRYLATRFEHRGDLRENLLRAAEKRMDERIDELKGLEAKAAQPAAEQKAVQARLKDLITMYDGMRPKDAARIFDRLDVKTLVEIVSAMNPRRSGEIVAAMDPAAAEKLVSGLLADGKPPPQSIDQLPKIRGEEKRR